jgi:hypothetical protein
MARIHVVAPSPEPRSSMSAQPRPAVRAAFRRSTEADDTRSFEVGTRSS